MYLLVPLENIEEGYTHAVVGITDTDMVNITRAWHIIQALGEPFTFIALEDVGAITITDEREGTLLYEDYSMLKDGKQWDLANILVGVNEIWWEMTDEDGHVARTRPISLDLLPAWRTR